MYKKNIFTPLFLFHFILFSCTSSQKESDGLINNDTSETKSVILDTSSISVNYDTKYSYRVFYTEEKTIGFGYELFVNNKRFIYQPTIPAIGGYKSFKTKDDAQKVVEYAIKKMIISGEQLPTLKIEELDSLKINY